MQIITNEAAINLAHRLRNDGHLIWYIGAKIILLLPNEAVSVKNRLELNRALHEASYLDADQCLEGQALAAFRSEAKKIMLDAADWIHRNGTPASKIQMKKVSHDISGVKALLRQNMGDMAKIEAAA
jgi:hypothetical protein